MKIIHRILKSPFILIYGVVAFFLVGLIGIYSIPSWIRTQDTEIMSSRVLPIINNRLYKWLFK